MNELEFFLERPQKTEWVVVKQHGIYASYTVRRNKRIKAKIAAQLLYRQKFIELSKTTHWREAHNGKIRKPAKN